MVATWNLATDRGNWRVHTELDELPHLTAPDRRRLDMVTAINNVGLARIDEHSLVTFGAAGPISQNVMQAENYGWKQSPRLESRIGIHHLALERIEARFYRNEGPSITLV